MARKKHHEEHENHERWLVSYADFITLLFAFFTVLYATSQKDIAKAKELEQSVRNAFRSFLDFGGVAGEHADSTGGSLIRPPIDLHPPMGSPAEVREGVQRLLDKALTEEEKPLIQDIRSDAIGVHLSLAAQALFPSGSDRLMKDSLRTLEKVARILKLTNRKIVVEGHTDDQDISTDRFASNWELSAARATRLVRYLIRNHEIEPSRLVAVAYADQKPLEKNQTEEARSRNRRIELLIVTGEWSP